MERQAPVVSKEVKKIQKQIKAKEKEIKRISKINKKRQEKQIKKEKKKRIKKKKKKPKKNKIVPKDIKKTKRIIKFQPLVIDRVFTLKQQLEKLKTKRKDVIERNTIERKGIKVMPESLNTILRSIDSRMKENIREQNELIEEWGLELQKTESFKFN